MANLLEETQALLERSLERVNVMWVGHLDGSLSMSWESFSAIAAETDYHSGFGSAEIPMNLVVVGPDWWLSRHEYDGAEGWVFNRIPVRPIGGDRPFTFNADPDDRTLEPVVERELLTEPLTHNPFTLQLS